MLSKQKEASEEKDVMARRRHSKLRIQERSLRTENVSKSSGTKSVKLEMSINSGDGSEQRWKITDG